MIHSVNACLAHSAVLCLHSVYVGRFNNPSNLQVINSPDNDAEIMTQMKAPAGNHMTRRWQKQNDTWSPCIQ